MRKHVQHPSLSPFARITQRRDPAGSRRQVAHDCTQVGFVRIRIVGFSFFGRPLIIFRSEKRLQIINRPKFLENKLYHTGTILKVFPHQSPPSFIRFLGASISQKVGLVNRKICSPPYKALQGITSLPKMRIVLSMLFANQRAEFFPILFLSQ